MALKSAVRLPAVARLLEREVQHKVNGEMQTEIQYYHRIVVVVLVSTESPIPLGVRFRKWGKRGRLRPGSGARSGSAVGSRFLDVLVGDALYLQAPFVQVEHLGLVWAFTLKENQPELCARRSVLPRNLHRRSGDQREIRNWHYPEVDWPVADRQIRAVKTVRIEQQRRVTVSAKDATRMKGKTAMSQPSTNFYATNFELGSISPLFLHQLSRSRWRIDQSLSDHHHRLSSQTPRGPPNHRPGGADHDPVSRLYPVPGLLPPPSPQPCSPKMRHLS